MRLISNGKSVVSVFGPLKTAMAVTVSQYGERVDPKDIDHAKPSALVGDVDLSAEKGSWKRYFWDSFDRSPEVCRDTHQCELVS